MKKLLFMSLFLTNMLSAGILPDYDSRCNAMKVTEADIYPNLNEDQQDYFNVPVPKIIHQIWFGDKSKMDTHKINNWKCYAYDCHFTHNLWTEDHLSVVQSFMKPENYRLLNVFLSEKNWWAASDILRYELLNHFGGVYIDCDFEPPYSDYGYVDLDTIFNLRGMTLVTEHHARNINTCALFVCNGFIVSCPHHPIMQAAVDKVHANAMHWHSVNKNFDAMFVTGPFFLNKILSGTFNLVPITYLKRFKCY